VKLAGSNIKSILKFVFLLFDRHAGLVCLCGKAISSLEKELDERRCLDFVLWSNFVASLQPTVRMITYNTFKKMVDNLITLDIAKGALDLLRSVFLEFFNFIQIHDLEEEDKQIF
jgi:hypothetical protein